MVPSNQLTGNVDSQMLYFDVHSQPDHAVGVPIADQRPEGRESTAERAKTRGTRARQPSCFQPQRSIRRREKCTSNRPSAATMTPMATTHTGAAAPVRLGKHEAPHQLQREEKSPSAQLEKHVKATLGALTPHSVGVLVDKDAGAGVGIHETRPSYNRLRPPAQTLDECGHPGRTNGPRPAARTLSRPVLGIWPGGFGAAAGSGFLRRYRHGRRRCALLSSFSGRAWMKALRTRLTNVSPDPRHPCCRTHRKMESGRRDLVLLW